MRQEVTLRLRGLNCLDIADSEVWAFGIKYETFTSSPKTTELHKSGFVVLAVYFKAVKMVKQYHGNFFLYPWSSI